MVRTKPQHAALYVRISKDDLKDGLGVKRQQKECLEYAEQIGWSVAEVYEDDDVSAFTGKRRESYERMLNDVRAGHRDGILAWHTSRLTRNVRQLEDIIDLHDGSGVALATVNGEIDLGTTQGRMMARIFANFDQAASEEAGDKIRSKHRELAESGQSHGGTWRTFGHDAKRVPDPSKSSGYRSEFFIVEEEAAVIRELTAKIIEHGSAFNLSAAARDLTARGITAVTGKPFGPETLKSVLTRWRLAGIRALNGVPQGPEGSSSQPSIITEEELKAVRAALMDPGRRTNAGQPRKYLLSNLPLCGKCGTRLMFTASTKKSGDRWEAYHCKACYLSIGRNLLEEVVVRHLSARLALPSGSLREFVDAEPEEVKGLRREHAEIMKNIGAAQDSPLPFKDVQPIIARYVKHREEIEASISTYMHRDALKGLLSDLRPLEKVKGSLIQGAIENRAAMRESFEKLELAKQRSIVAALLRIEVAPALEGKRKRSDSLTRISLTALDPADGLPVDEYDEIDEYAQVQ